MSVITNYAPGESFDALPLPGFILDGYSRFVGLNDTAEIWLNLSRRMAFGHRLNDEIIQSRLRIVPNIFPLIERVRNNQYVINQPGFRFELGNRAGGYYVRSGDLHLGPASPDLPEGVIVLVAPTDAAAGMEPGYAARKAVRQAVGMAEMLVHEIKNPLSGIRGAAQLLSVNMTNEDRELTDLIVTESRRIVSLLDQVEQFGNTTMPVLKSVNLHDVLERTRRLAECGFADDHKIITEYDPSLPNALGDQDQLVQVILNLLKNAVEALNKSVGDGSGKPTIRIRSFYDGALRITSPENSPAGLILPLQIEIEDNGPGIPEAIASQIFEPFVSGRTNGTGLGLALVSKIIADHGGWLRVESRIGRTVFRISLPRA